MNLKINRNGGYKRVCGGLILTFCGFGLSGCGVSGDTMTSSVNELLDATQHMVRSFMAGSEADVPPLEVESVSVGKYAYDTLNDEEKKVYDEMLYAIENREESVRLATSDQATMEKAYQAMFCDNGYIFWNDGYSYIEYIEGEETVAYDFQPSFTMEAEQQADYQKQVDAAVAEILSGISGDVSDYEKALYVYETLINQVSYVEDAKQNQNILSAFLYKATVCQGYACATQYLLNELGIESTIVMGEANGEPHAWNLVKMDGDYYYVDTTWGNTAYFSEEANEEKYVDYNYFGITSADLLKTHKVDDIYTLPECTATADNYFIHEGRYVEAWDPDLIGGLYGADYADGVQLSEVKFASQDLLEQCISYFIEDENIVDYCDGIESLEYMTNETEYMLSLIYY